MAQNDEFEYESIQDHQTIKDLVHGILDGFEKGRIVLASNGDEISMRPSGMLKLSVKARKKGETGKLNLKISWKEAKKVIVSTDDRIKVTS